MTIFTWLAVGETVWIIGLSLWIVLERRSPTATLAWIFALAWLPIVGVAVYLLIGPRRLRRKRLRYRRSASHIAESARAVRSLDSGVQDGHSWRQLATLAIRAGQGPPRRACRVEILPTGDGCYRAIERAIEAAQHHVHLEYYIWEPDGTGARLRDLLCDKARSGVRVRLLVDAIGSAGLTRRFFRPLRETGAEIAWFNPLSLARLRPDLMNFRTHRKIIVCDGRSGFTGGINVCDEQCQSARGDHAWRDTHVHLEGPPVAELQLAFLEDWHFATGNAPVCRNCFPQQAAASGPWVQIIGSGPDSDLYAIERFCLAAISSAQHRVLMTTPYFVPNEPLLAALATTALRGVDVKVLVPHKSDSWLVTAAARSYFDELMRLGVRVYQYGPPMLHSKTLVVDDALAMIGSANMDNRSFRLNFEIVAAFYDQAVAGQLADIFHEDLRLAKEYCLHEARKTPVLQRMAQATARLMSPLL